VDRRLVGVDRPVSRRAWLSALAGGAGVVAVACQTTATSTELNTPEGRVIQWEGPNMLILVTGLQQQYQAGDVIRLNVLLNNQSNRVVDARVRTKLTGLGDQPVVQTEAVQLTVGTQDASSVDQQLPTGRDLPPGDFYNVSVEVPPWTVDGRETGQGARLRAPIQVVPRDPSR
jgi:hypothetical protein